MRLASLGAIVTRSVSPVMLISALVLTGCQSVFTDTGGEWQVKTFNATKLRAVSAISIDQMLVDRLIQDYKKFPKDSGYTELTLSRVLEDGEGSGRRYFVFDLRYVDDVSVVYVLDSRNVTLEKFLASPWRR
jgi:hypothetical protein